MNISSVIVRVRPAKLPAIRADLAAMPGVTVHADAGDGRLIVTIEDEGNHRAADGFMAVHNIDGVMAVSLVYQFDDGLSEEINP